MHFKSRVINFAFPGFKIDAKISEQDLKGILNSQLKKIKKIETQSLVKYNLQFKTENLYKNACSLGDSLIFLSLAIENRHNALSKFHSGSVKSWVLQNLYEAQSNLNTLIHANQTMLSNKENKALETLLESSLEYSRIDALAKKNGMISNAYYKTIKNPKAIDQAILQGLKGHFLIAIKEEGDLHCSYFAIIQGKALPTLIFDPAFGTIKSTAQQCEQDFNYLIKLHKCKNIEYLHLFKMKRFL